jgi:hypothetical protein
MPAEELCNGTSRLERYSALRITSIDLVVAPIIPGVSDEQTQADNGVKALPRLENSESPTVRSACC